MIVFCGVVFLVFVGQLLIERVVNPRNNILNNVTDLARLEMESLASASSEFFGSVAERFARTISLFESWVLTLFSVILAIGLLSWLVVSLIRLLFR
jgi:hypothetical protein